MTYLSSSLLPMFHSTKPSPLNDPPSLLLNFARQRQSRPGFIGGVIVFRRKSFALVIKGEQYLLTDSHAREDQTNDRSGPVFVTGNVAQGEILGDLLFQHHGKFVETSMRPEEQFLVAFYSVRNSRFADISKCLIPASPFVPSKQWRINSYDSSPYAPTESQPKTSPLLLLMCELNNLLTTKLTLENPRQFLGRLDVNIGVLCACCLQCGVTN
eukprot:Lithocolla_globosa_v1_NODE_4422_length_1438_cov_278.452639.p1 type:complete len:213 gc:universal NODE_4422_length_1438_cov_278.452639:386-1024(+)